MVERSLLGSIKKNPTNQQQQQNLALGETERNLEDNEGGTGQTEHKNTSFGSPEQVPLSPCRLCCIGIQILDFGCGGALMCGTCRGIIPFHAFL